MPVIEQHPDVVAVVKRLTQDYAYRQEKIGVLTDGGDLLLVSRRFEGPVLAPVVHVVRDRLPADVDWRPRLNQLGLMYL